MATRQATWQRTHTTAIRLTLNHNTDKDILDKLSSVGNRQGYIKRLIREDIARTAGQDQR